MAVDFLKRCKFTLQCLFITNCCSDLIINKPVSILHNKIHFKLIYFPDTNLAASSDKLNPPHLYPKT